MRLLDHSHERLMSFGLKNSLTDVSFRSTGHASGPYLVSSWSLETVALRPKADCLTLVCNKSLQTVRNRPKWDLRVSFKIA